MVFKLKELVARIDSKLHNHLVDQELLANPPSTYPHAVVANCRRNRCWIFLTIRAIYVPWSDMTVFTGAGSPFHPICFSVDELFADAGEILRVGRWVQRVAGEWAGCFASCIVTGGPANAHACSRPHLRDVSHRRMLQELSLDLILRVWDTYLAEHGGSDGDADSPSDGLAVCLSPSMWPIW
jgi:hypothetical protein